MTLFRPAPSLSDGPDPVRLTADDAAWAYCGLHIIELGPGEQRIIDLDDSEAAVVPLRGSCRVTADGLSFDLIGRTGPFDGLTDLCYLPSATVATITSEIGGEFAVATARTTEVRPARYFPASDVPVSVRGSGQATRQINDLLGADVAGPHRLIVVEVLTPESNWSSYPPHKHDEWSDAEVPLEEIYYFRIAGANGFGFHRTYTTDGEIDQTVTVRDGDTFLIPRGYHGPCVAAPGYDMYYLNVMAGPDEQRRWLICNDPQHDWVTDEWKNQQPDTRVPMYAV